MIRLGGLAALALAVGGVLAGCSPKCGPSSCVGCCDTAGLCQPGVATNKCGAGGAACGACGAGQQCTAGSCVDVTQSCSPSSCNTCCNGNVCLASGQNCPNGEGCVSGVCQTTTDGGGSCNAATCPQGCCQGGACIELANQTTACGFGGTACVSCIASTSSCQGGRCIAGCGPGNCPTGCCQGSSCQTPGNTTSTCGTGGVGCLTCSGAAAECVSGHCGCTSGCVDGVGSCQAGTSSTACGSTGAVCQACPTGQGCVNGQCVAGGCSPANCSGCCSASGTCVNPGNMPAACGSGGGACQVCAANQQCSGGVCTSNTCNANSCPTGCCTGQGLCVTGPSQIATSCGAGGSQCVDCTQTVGASASCQVGATGGACAAAPDAGPAGGVGDPCTRNSDCVGLLSTGFASAQCLLTTADGGAAYDGGFCTLLNCTIGSCPGDSQCVMTGSVGFGGMPPYIDLYGETRTMCWPGCLSDFDCNIPQYACFGGNNIDPTGTTFDINRPGLGCFISEPAKAGQSGQSCNPSDKSVPAFEACALPPTNGGCFAFGLSDGGVSAGVCGSDCLGALVDPNPNSWCGDGGMCLITLVDPNNFPIQATCEQRCPAPNGGTSNCTPGYVCWGGITQPDGGPAPYGFCQPDCHALGGCNPGHVCIDAGSCR